MYSNVHGEFTVLIRELSPRDSAVYRVGVGNEKHKDVELTVQSGSSVIITVFVCGTMLLIGGSALIIYKLRKHTIQDSASTGQRAEKKGDGVYDNVPHGKQYNISMGPVYQSLNPYPDTSELIYEDLDPNTNQSDSDYENMVDNGNQSNFIYGNLNINSSG
ncbi:hypothetical protein MHYP_G00104000 [Metynnis hypsauchen]